MIFLGSVTERNFGLKAAIYGLLRLLSKTCKLSSTMKSYESAKRKCYDKRILSIKRTASLETSLLVPGFIITRYKFRKREISHSGKGQCPLCKFFPESVFDKQTLINSLAQSS